MELKRRRFSFRKVATILYIVAFLVYLIVGLQPVGAAEYEISGELIIPSIHLTSDVTTLELINHELLTPATIAGSYSKYDSKTLLIGHSTTVFQDLDQIEVGDVIFYQDAEYKVAEMVTLPKNDVKMGQIIGPTKDDTLIVMTCAGESLGGGDASHRLIVTATKM